MSPAIAIGGITILLGLVIAGDPKMFGFKTAALGIAIAAAGGFLVLFGMYGNTESGNREGRGRRVRDHSV